MERRKASQLRGLAGMFLNLAVAVFTVRLIAPRLEFMGRDDGAVHVSLWQSVSGGAIGVVLLVLGLYLLGRAEE